MDQKQKIKFWWDYQLDPVDINAETSYFYVFPFPHNKHHNPKLAEKPYILTYRDDSISIKHLLQQYITKNPKLKDYQSKKLVFTLSDGHIPNHSGSISSLSKLVRNNNLNGLVLFLEKVDNHRSGDSSEQDQQVVDECAMQEYISFNSDLNCQFNLNICFELPEPNRHVITIKIRDTQRVDSLVKSFLGKVKEVFGVSLQWADIHQLRLMHSKGGKVIDLLQQTDKQIIQLSFLVDWSTFVVLFKHNKKYEFKRAINNPHHRLIIYKEHSQEFITQFFEQVEILSFHTLYKEKLRSKDKPPTKKDHVCLKVMDILVLQDENLSKISGLYQASKAPQLLNVVGRVVTEKMYLYKTLSTLSNRMASDFKIEDYIIPSDSEEERDQFRKRIQNKIRSRASGSKIEHFRIMSNVEPIYIYTCQDVHHNDENSPTKSSPIYKIVNQTLRDDQIFKKDLKQLAEDWKYCFSTSLLKQMQLLPRISQKTVYRGVNYDPKVQRGGIVSFKSFTSTSTKLQATYQFMNSNDSTLFQMEIKSPGKNIVDFSDFPIEEEVLLPPYTQFRVVDIKDLPQGQMMKRKIRLVELDQSQSSSKYPDSIANFIIWIDDKQYFEGQDIYNNIKVVEHPTILIHLNSNQQLVDWLNQQKVQKIMKDPTANFGLVSNMTRQGNGLAGIEAIVQIQRRPFVKKVPIFLYIGDVKLSVQKVRQNRHKIKNYQEIQVGNDPQEVERFLLRVINCQGEQSLAKSQSMLNPEIAKAKSVISGQKQASGKSQSSFCLTM